MTYIPDVTEWGPQGGDSKVKGYYNGDPVFDTDDLCKLKLHECPGDCQNYEADCYIQEYGELCQSCYESGTRICTSKDCGRESGLVHDDYWNSITGLCGDCEAMLEDM